MYTFNEEEIKELEKFGFVKQEDDTYLKADYFNGDITIQKIDEDDFILYYDVHGTDLERANNNETKTDLTWTEIINLIGSYN